MEWRENDSKRENIVKDPCPVGLKLTLNASPNPSKGMEGNILANNSLKDVKSIVE